MSHSTVLVAGPRTRDELSAALEPFCEELEVEPYHDYVDPCPEGWETTAALQAAFLRVRDEGGIEHRKAWGLVYGPDVHSVEGLPWPRSVAHREGGVDPTDDKAVAEFYNAKYADDEKYSVDEGGLYVISTYNPKSRWDWWTVGGRWLGLLSVKEGAAPQVIAGESGAFDNDSLGGVNSCRIADLDFDAMNAREAEWGRQRYQEWAKDPERFFSLGRRPEDGETEETFVERVCQPFTTHALLVNGEWIESSRMGWWGMTGPDEHDNWADVWRKTLDSLDPDTVVTVVDVHI